MKNYRDLYIKQLIATKSIEYAANDLEITAPNISYVEQKELPNQYITSVFLPNLYVIVFSESWIEKAKFEDVILTSLHETRHAYQYCQIQNHNKGLKIKEKEKTIRKWYSEFIDYVQSISHGKDQVYLSQYIEEDAVKYAINKVNNLSNKGVKTNG